MTPIFNLWLLLGALFWGPPAVYAAPAEPPLHKVTGLHTTGLVRTNRDWLVGYIDQPLPASMSDADGAALARKLLTTGVFSHVVVSFESDPADPAGSLLHVTVDEKWTIIPVVRGAYGGGTPLRVLGLYDTHAFGQLTTLGGEVRKYGDAPLGYILYARDPRARAGRYALGAEYWREFRRRQVFDAHGDELGAASTDTALARVRLLTPMATGEAPLAGFRWKWGGEVEALQAAPSRFDPLPGATPPSELKVGGRQTLVRLLPTVQFDGIDTDNLTYDGYRFKLRLGPTLAGGKSYRSFDSDAYAYWVAPQQVNVAVHAFVGQTSFDGIQGQYFLGGLESIRGLPDGAIYGTHAAFANAEVRHLFAKFDYLWLQSVAFLDAGSAGPGWTEAGKALRSSAGLGLRLAVPQIYRLIFRLDYAWSTDGSGTHGITAGMSQFFDPFTPL